MVCSCIKNSRIQTRMIYRDLIRDDGSPTLRGSSYVERIIHPIPSGTLLLQSNLVKSVTLLLFVTYDMMQCGDHFSNLTAYINQRQRFYQSFDSFLTIEISINEGNKLIVSSIIGSEGVRVVINTNYKNTTISHKMSPSIY